jgi:hypothetical protein
VTFAIDVRGTDRPTVEDVRLLREAIDVVTAVPAMSADVGACP